MNCQSCNKNSATIHLTEIVNGQRIEKHLCENCAQTEGVAVNAQIPLTDLLNNLLAAQPQDKENFNANNISCPSCNIDMEQINDQSLLGCPDDYEIFDKSMDKIIENSQDGSTVHCGKVPQTQNNEKTHEHELELIDMKRQLNEAVSQERYEDAAQLRDKISLLQ